MHGGIAWGRLRHDDALRHDRAENFYVVTVDLGCDLCLIIAPGTFVVAIGAIAQRQLGLWNVALAAASATSMPQGHLLRPSEPSHSAA